MCVIKVCSNGCITYITLSANKKTKDNLNVANLMQKPLKILFSENIQQNSFLLHTNSPWVCVIKVCSNGGAIYIIGE